MTKYTVKDNPEIEKILVISTGHLSQKDNQLLKLKCYPHTVFERDEGYLIFILEDEPIYTSNSIDFIKDEDEMHSQLYKYTVEFRKILRMAQNKKCSWIMFDRDASTYEDLKEFEW